MKASSYPEKSKSQPGSQLEKSRSTCGELFLGYKALHELRILLRIASNRNQPEPKDGDKPSY